MSRIRRRINPLDRLFVCVYIRRMTPFRRLRKEILKVTQAHIAEVTGTTQATVSRWESGELYPDARQLAALRSKWGRKVNLNTLSEGEAAT